jgi:hypothetical protein
MYVCRSSRIVSPGRMQALGAQPTLVSQGRQGNPFGGREGVTRVRASPPVRPVGKEAMSTIEIATDLRRRRTAALAAVSYVLFFVVSLILPTALGQHAVAPSPYASDDEVARKLAVSAHNLVPVAAFWQAMSALALLVFVPYAAHIVRQRVPDTVAAGLVQVGGITAGALLVLSASVQWISFQPTVAADVHLYRMVTDLVFITGAAPHVAALGIATGAIAYAAHQTGAMPAWLNWFGLVIAALSLVSMLSLMFEPATIFIPLGRYPGMLWFLGVAAVLWSQRARGEITTPIAQQ